MLATAGNLQQVSSFSLFIKTWLLERAISITQVQRTLCVSHPWGALLATCSQHLLIPQPWQSFPP